MPLGPKRQGTIALAGRDLDRAHSLVAFIDQKLVENVIGFWSAPAPAHVVEHVRRRYLAAGWGEVLVRPGARTGPQTDALSWLFVSERAPLDSRSRYAHLEPGARERAALEDALELVSQFDAMDEERTTDVQNILNQGLCRGRAAGCACDWCDDAPDDVIGATVCANCGQPTIGRPGDQCARCLSQTYRAGLS